MRDWPEASVVFFVYVGMLSLALRQLGRRQRRLALTGSLTGIVVTLGSQLTPNWVLNDWVVPPALLLIAYWTSGLLYRAPMPRAERTLCRIDKWLRVRALAARTPRAVAELLELAYVAVYPVVPLALVIHVATSGAADPGRFWATILLTDYICFGM